MFYVNQEGNHTPSTKHMKLRMHEIQCDGERDFKCSAEDELHVKVRLHGDGLHSARFLVTASTKIFVLGGYHTCMHASRVHYSPSSGSVSTAASWPVIGLASLHSRA